MMRARKLWVCALQLSSLRSLPTGDYVDAVLKDSEGKTESPCAGPVSEHSRSYITWPISWTSTVMSTDTSSPSQPPNFPSRVPPPTGNIVYDSLQARFVADICPEAITYVGNAISQSAKHVTELPCARNALLAGIVSGAGMGVIRGMAAGKRS